MIVIYVFYIGNGLFLLFSDLGGELKNWPTFPSYDIKVPSNFLSVTRLPSFTDFGYGLGVITFRSHSEIKV